MNQNSQKFSLGRLIAIFLVFSAIAVTFVYVVNKPHEPKDSGLISTDGWKTMTNTEGITFSYPENISTIYIHPIGWPPKVSISNEPFACNEIAMALVRVGQTKRQTINGNQYCVKSVPDGAAGSVYVQYSFLSKIDNEKTANLVFDLRFVQCGNYDEPKKSQCEIERGSFDISPIADAITKSILF